MGKFGSMVTAILVQLAAGSALSVIDESVRTIVRERVKRSRVCTPNNLGS